ncbi:hypothetical protein [Halorubrum sp. DTA98]|uniref:hypothetical protein n=1 Tax=Halorubrum sp. DTA98 TaxID=3402163 RepID=UPI003AAFA099
MEYQPGVCNIGPSERRKRLALGVASLLAAVVLVAAVLAIGWRSWTLLFTLFPLYGAAMGVLQYRERFCVGFAGMGVFDVGDGTRDVTDPKALEADRKRAVRLNAKALAVGGVGALAVYAVVLVAF